MLFCAPVASDAEYTLPALLNALVPVLIVLLCCCLSLLCAVVLVLSCICMPKNSEITLNFEIRRNLSSHA